ncbi:MAG: hypothetical protein ACI3ZG_06680 [Candidatus Coprenecus sp.]
MRRITPIIVYMTIFLTLISCRRTENIIVDSVEMSEFLLLKTPCYIVNEELMYEYDIHRDQFSFNYARNCFRFFTPNQESFLCCVLSLIPKKEGEMTQARIIFGDKEKRNDTTTQMQCCKIENNYIWLWDRMGKKGLVLEIK